MGHQGRARGLVALTDAQAEGGGQIDIPGGGGGLDGEAVFGERRGPTPIDATGQNPLDLPQANAAPRRALVEVFGLEA